MVTASAQTLVTQKNLCWQQNRQLMFCTKELIQSWMSQRAAQKTLLRFAPQ
jgi:hypothetical protein